MGIKISAQLSDKNNTRQLYYYKWNQNRACPRRCATNINCSVWDYLPLLQITWNVKYCPLCHTTCVYTVCMHTYNLLLSSTAKHLCRNEQFFCRSSHRASLTNLTFYFKPTKCIQHIQSYRFTNAQVCFGGTEPSSGELTPSFLKTATINWIEFVMFVYVACHS